MPPSPEPLRFSCRSARSPAMLWTFAGLIVVETAALHLLLVRLVPFAAWGLTLASLSALAWLVADDRALRRDDAVRVEGTRIRCAVGKRLDASFDRGDVKQVLTPTWRDLAGTPRPFNATKPASPNVLIAFSRPQRVRVLGGMERSIERLALHLDAPEEFVALLSGKP